MRSSRPIDRLTKQSINSPNNELENELCDLFNSGERGSFEAEAEL